MYSDFSFCSQWASLIIIYHYQQPKNMNMKVFLFDGDMDRLGEFFEPAIRRIPVLGELGMRTIVNGPITITGTANLDAGLTVNGYFNMPGGSSAILNIDTTDVGVDIVRNGECLGDRRAGGRAPRGARRWRIVSPHCRPSPMRSDPRR